MNKKENQFLSKIWELLKTNSKHLAVLNDEVGAVKIHQAAIRTDVKWLKKFFWYIAGAAVGGLITALSNLLLK